MRLFGRIADLLLPLLFISILFGGAAEILAASAFYFLGSLVALAAGIMLIRGAGQKAPLYIFDIILPALFFLLLVNVVLSPDSFSGRWYIYKFSVFAGILYFIRIQFAKRLSVNSMALALAGLGAITAALSIIIFLLGWLIEGHPSVGSGTFLTPPALACFVGIGLCLSAGMYLTARKQPGSLKWLLLSETVLCIIALLLTGFRPAIISVIFAGWLVLMFFVPGIKRTIGLLIGTGTAALLLIAAVLLVIGYLDPAGFNPITQGHLKAIAAAFELWRESPMLGNGVGSFAILLPKVFGDPLAIPSVDNFTLLPIVLSETGIVGMSVVLLTVGITLLFWRDNCKRRHDPIIRGVLIGASFALLSVLFHSIFDYSLLIFANLIYLTVTVGAGISAATAKNRPVPERSSGADIWRRGGGALLVTLSILAGLFNLGVYLSVQYNNLGNSHIKLGAEQKALGAFGRGRSFCSSYSSNWLDAARLEYGMALSLEKTEEEKESLLADAQSLTEIAVANNSYDSQALVLLARIYRVRGGSTVMVTQLAERAAWVGGDNPVVALDLAELLLDIGRIDEACAKASRYLQFRRGRISDWIGSLLEAKLGAQILNCLPARSDIFGKAVLDLADRVQGRTLLPDLIRDASLSGLRPGPEAARKLLQKLETRNIAPDKIDEIIDELIDAYLPHRAGFLVRYRISGAMMDKSCPQRLLKTLASTDTPADVIAKARCRFAADSDQSLPFWQKKVELLPGVAAYRKQLAFELAKVGNQRESRKQLNRVREMVPFDPELPMLIEQLRNIPVPAAN
jgi:tetratricopeptide (TPR) repeat protein